MPRAGFVGGLKTRGGRSRRYLYRRRNAFLRAWRQEADREHLVHEPVFVLCSVRSGSTLLRSMLDTHTQICAPHELHLNTMRVSTQPSYATKSWHALGYEMIDLENMLWDRALHRMLVASSKRLIVDKTPQNVEVWTRINDYWPRARYIHLRRHPVSILESLTAARPETPISVNIARVREYCENLDEARASLPGPTVYYEELTADPERVTRELCDYLGVRWQRRILQYKKGAYVGGLGDWSENIRSGQVQPARPLPPAAQIPPELREQVRAWGYA